MSQAGLSLANAAGAIFRAALNAALQALATNNSGATEPSPTYPNMWWYDTANAQLKRRNNANDAWIVLGLEAASTDGTMAANSDSLVPTQKAAKTYADTKVAASALDTDGTLAANSDSKVATQKAGKTYADTKLSKTTSGEIAALTEKTTLADNDVFIIEDSAAGNSKKRVKKSNIGNGKGDYIAGSFIEAYYYKQNYYSNQRNVWYPIPNMSVTATRSGIANFTFTAWEVTDDANPYVRLYKNGEPVGVQKTLAYGSTETIFTDTNIAVTAGDVFTVWGYLHTGTSTDSVYGQMLLMQVANPTIEGPKIVVSTNTAVSAPGTAPTLSWGNNGDMYAFLVNASPDYYKIFMRVGSTWADMGVTVPS